MMLTICNVESCDTPVGRKGARGMCSRHYQSLLRIGVPVRSCAGCGEPLERTSFKYCSDACKPRCSVDGCDGAVRKTGWCASHYHQAKASGRDPLPFKWKWSPAALRQSGQGEPNRSYMPFVIAPCLNCGVVILRRTRGVRLFCTQNCYQAHRLHGGPRPTSTTCVACGGEISLTERGKKGQQRKSDVKFCRPCKRDYAKYKMSARELAQRDGTDCGICGEPVDMSIPRSVSLDCPSVDHVLPRARGGTHDPSNLQLAHLRCNMVKSDRVEAEIGCK